MISLHPPQFSIVWFKRDLRLHDHAPLHKALKLGLPVLPLYIIEPEYWQLPDVSGRHWHFIHDCLTQLNQDLQAQGAPLVVLKGEAIPILSHIRQSHGPFQLFSHEETGNAWTYTRDRQVATWCREHAIAWQEFPSNGVVRCLKSRDGWAQLRATRMAQPLIPNPQGIMSVPGLIIPNLSDKNMPPVVKEFSGKVQPGGRSQGLYALNSFLKERCAKYIATISKPGLSARHCSRLSAHIAYGTLSIKEIEQATRAKMQQLDAVFEPEAAMKRRNLAAFLSRLAWRCHFVQKLEQQPEIEFHCMHPAFTGMREPYHNQDFFEAWQQGNTGYPLVDACMRSLHANGWITFRMRALIVSFASYHLWLDWRMTGPYLAQLFTDYEPGIHYSQLQMQSGVTGINAVRIYNPIKQSYDQDPDGAFIRRYVPELKDLPSQWLHEPWGFGRNLHGYPAPIIHHETALRQARERISHYRRSQDFAPKAAMVKSKLASRKRRPSKQVQSPKQLEFNWRPLQE